MGTQPNDPMYNYGNGYPPTGPPSNQGRGLALAGLILGVVGLVLCWVPFLNVIALIVALVGLALSVAALVIAVRRRTSAKGLSIAGTIVSGLAVIASIIAIALVSAFFSSLRDSMYGDTAGPYGNSTGTPAPATTGTGTGTGSGSATAAPNLLPIGSAAEIGEYSVTVSGVQLDATDAIVNFNPYNQPPSGQYVLITLDVVYTGNEEGDPWLDLSTSFVGSDSRQYSESTCAAVLDLEGTSVPTLENGGQAQYEVCMDVPPTAIPGDRVLVEETLGFNGPREASWATQ